MFLGLTRLWVVVIVIVITQISLAYCIHIHSSDPVVPHNYFQVALGTADNALWAWLLAHWALLSKAMEPSGPMLVHGERGGGRLCLLPSQWNSVSCAAPAPSPTEF